VPRKQAGHMTCTRPQAARQILLATRASSTHDPKATCPRNGTLVRSTLRSRLPEHYRQIVLLRDVDELTIDEIAQSLSLSREAVKGRLHLARGLIREYLTG
jgi:DNA-directed RNA polymerase specialized sigma24 family protein